MDSGVSRIRDGSPVAPVPAVVIAMLTYRRPAELRAVLPQLAEQAASISPAARVLVVDNDPAGSAREQVLAAGAQYVHEPRPGISAARNCALAAAGDARLLAFIDDDERPGPDWLRQLVGGWQQWQCAAVAGPVRAVFPRTPDAWLTGSGAFAARRHRTGDHVPGAATHNLLLDLEQVRGLDLRFDEQLGLTGGEDTMFSHQLVARGGEIRWCEDAAVFEPVAESRLNRRWVLRRSFRAGTSWSRMELVLAGSPRRRARCRASLLVRGVANLAAGGAAVLAAVVTRDLARRARGEVTLASYAGLLAGAFGGTLREYGRTGGAAA